MDHLSGFLQETQLGLVGHNTPSARQGLQAACVQRIAESVTTNNIACCKDADKVFCAAWLDHDNVLVGTKCNKLRQVHLPTRTWQEVPYPAQPVHRFGPDLLARANSPHCGQHASAVSPSGTFLVTGGAAAEDVLLWRLQPNAGASSSSSSRGSSLRLQPLQTFMGHADWLFGLDWLSDKHWVTAGRDGAIKLWQVPTAAEAAGATYTADPGSALLSVAYHEGKVRAISFDQQQQQTVALSTDQTVSWWTPDLRLKGSARVPGAYDPAAVATCGDLVAVGSLGMCTLLDTRAPGGGIKRSGSGSAPSNKRSRAPAGWAAAGGFQPGRTPWAAEAAAATGCSVAWLPPAYACARPARPAVLAVTAHLPGMQVLQQTSSQASMDPMVAEQLLRQEAAAQAVAEGRPFDETLRGLVQRLLALPPPQQLQQLQALRGKCRDHSRVSSDVQALQHARDILQRSQLQLERVLAGRGVRLEGAQQQQPRGGFTWDQQQPQQQPGWDNGPDTRSEGVEEAVTSDDSGFSGDDDGDDGDGDDDGGSSGDEGDAAGAFASAPPAGAAAAAPGQQLPDQIRYMLERSRPDSHLVRRQQQQQQQQSGGLGSLPDEQELSAWVRGTLKYRQGVPVRSLSFHSGQVLGVGHRYLDLFDLRCLSGLQLQLDPVLPVLPGNLLQRLMPEGPSFVDPVLVEHGYGRILDSGMELIVYAHCWDPSGTRLLSAGGPMALGCKGAFVQLGA